MVKPQLEKHLSPQGQSIKPAGTMYKIGKSKIARYGLYSSLLLMQLTLSNCASLKNTGYVFKVGETDPTAPQKTIEKNTTTDTEKFYKPLTNWCKEWKKTCIGLGVGIAIGGGYLIVRNNDNDQKKPQNNNHSTSGGTNTNSNNTPQNNNQNNPPISGGTNTGGNNAPQI